MNKRGKMGIFTKLRSSHLKYLFFLSELPSSVRVLKFIYEMVVTADGVCNILFWQSRGCRDYSNAQFFTSENIQSCIQSKCWRGIGFSRKQKPCSNNRRAPTSPETCSFLVYSGAPQCHGLCFPALSVSAGSELCTQKWLTITWPHFTELKNRKI